MEVKDWIDFVVAVLAGMATAIPLVYKLVQLVKTLIPCRFKVAYLEKLKLKAHL